jgi:hypothetical protein
VKATREFGVLKEPIAVSPDVDDVAVVDQPVDERRSHLLVADSRLSGASASASGSGVALDTARHHGSAPFE